MILEEALKTDRFRNEQHKLLIHLWYTRSVLLTEQRRLFRAYKITPEQYNILRILVGQKGNPLALNDLTARMIDPSSNTSRLVEKLRVKGLLVRSECPDDRRRVDVLITEEGTDLVRKVNPEVEVLESHFEKVISAEDARAINETLERFHASLENINN
jgi:DNA-binding MarR family transcriptional regulator